MLRRAAAIALLAMGLVTPAGTAMTDQIESRVELAASVKSQTATEVVIDYSVTNRSGVPIYVFDIVARFDKGQVVVDEHAAYVVLAPDGAVRVIAALFKVTKRINATPPILVSVVEPGQSMRGSLELPLPLRERHPYFPILGPNEGSAPVKASTLRLTIGWVEHRAQTTVSERKTQSGTFHQLTGNWGQPLQRFRSFELAVDALPVVRHPENIAPQAILLQ